MSQLPKPQQRPSLFEKTPWESHITEINVEEDSPLVGVRLQDLGEHIPQRSLLVTHIQRGSKSLVNPGGLEVLFPLDILGALGEDESLQKLDSLAKAKTNWSDADEKPELFSVELGSGHIFSGKSLAELNLRQTHQVLVVGVERGGQRFPSPGAQFTLEDHDRVWVVGNPSHFQDQFDGIK